MPCGCFSPVEDSILALVEPHQVFLFTTLQLSQLALPLCRQGVFCSGCFKIHTRGPESSPENWAQPSRCQGKAQQEWRLDECRKQGAAVKGNFAIARILQQHFGDSLLDKLHCKQVRRKVDVHALGKIAVEAEGTAILGRKVLKMYCTQNDTRYDAQAHVSLHLQINPAC